MLKTDADKDMFSSCLKVVMLTDSGRSLNLVLPLPSEGPLRWFDGLPNWLIQQLDHPVITTPLQSFYGPFSRTTWVSSCQKRTSGLYGARRGVDVYSGSSSYQSRCFIKDSMFRCLLCLALSTVPGHPLLQAAINNQKTVEHGTVYHQPCPM